MKPLTRDQAIELCGLDAVDRVESANAEFSHCVPDGTVEFSTSVWLEDGLRLTVYYHQDPAAVDAVENLDELKWVPSHYTLT